MKFIMNEGTVASSEILSGRIKKPKNVDLFSDRMDKKTMTCLSYSTGPIWIHPRALVVKLQLLLMLLPRSHAPS